MNMQNYQIQETLGEGAYGIVYKAIHRKTNQIVAIKQIFEKTQTWNLAKNQIELKSFEEIKPHRNIVTLYEAFREKDGTFYFVFEYVDSGSLYDFFSENVKLQMQPSEDVVRKLLFETLLGLNHMHQNNFMHRDLKPENIMLQNSQAGVDVGKSRVIPKIADLGCAKETRQRFNVNSLYTGTRWYRAPEMLLKETDYSAPIDVWAVGVVFFEILTNRVMFPGSSELDMLNLIFSMLGPIYDGEWTSFERQSAKINFVTAETSETHWESGMSHQRIKSQLERQAKFVSDELLDVIAHCLEISPEKRHTCEELVAHRVFRREMALEGANDNLIGSPTHSLVTKECDSIGKAKEFLSELGSDKDKSVPRSVSVRPDAGTHVNIKDLLDKQRQKDDDITLDFDFGDV